MACDRHHETCWGLPVPWAVLRHLLVLKPIGCQVGGSRSAIPWARWTGQAVLPRSLPPLFLGTFKFRPSVCLRFPSFCSLDPLVLLQECLLGGVQPESSKSPLPRAGHLCQAVAYPSRPGSSCPGLFQHCLRARSSQDLQPESSGHRSFPLPRLGQATSTLGLPLSAGRDLGVVAERA